jgi:hypothetical protein
MPRRDLNQIAASIVAQTTGEAKPEPKPEKNAAAVALGRLGGAKGGPARALALNADRRKEIASKAAQKRWKKEGS